jgi:transglutaminase-like putative cysteine protease
MRRVALGPSVWRFALTCSLLLLSPAGAIATDHKPPPFAGYTKYLRYKIDYRVNPDGTDVESHDWALKVLAEQGLSSANRASVSFSDELERATILAAYTMKANGKRIDVPPRNFQQESNTGRGKASPMFSDIRTITVAFPDVAVGDTVVMSYKITEKEALFPGNFSFIESFSRFETFDKAEITLSVPTSIKIYVEQRGVDGGEIASSGGRRNWKWSYHNDEEAIPEPGAVSTLDYSPMIVGSTFRDYGALAAAYDARARAKAAVTPTVRKLADQLTGNLNSPRDKARGIYNWVATNIQYVGNDVGVGSVVPHAADLVIANRMGDCKDHATLLQALLAAKGIRSMSVLLNGSSAYTLPKVAAVGTFDHVINYVPSLNLYLDSTSRFTPFGRLPFDDADKPVVRTEGFSEIEHTPPMHYQDNGTTVTTLMDLRPDGSATGKTTVVANGMMADEVRASIVYLQPNMEELAVRRSLERNGLVGTGNLFKDDPQKLSSHYSYGASYGLKELLNVPGPGAIAISAPYASGETIAAFAEEANEPDRTVNYQCMGEITREEYTIKLPKNIQILAIPRNTRLTSGPLVYDSKYKLVGNVVTASRALQDHTVGDVCTPAEAAQQKAFAMAVRRDLRAQIVYR